MKNFLFTLILISSCALVVDTTWAPKIDIELESSSHIETLHWVSGVSYTLSALQNMNGATFAMHQNQ